MPAFCNRKSNTSFWLFKHNLGYAIFGPLKKTKKLVLKAGPSKSQVKQVSPSESDLEKEALLEALANLEEEEQPQPLIKRPA